jgi:hypothetical protein
MVVPAAAHEQFTDGPRFRPALVPFHRPARRVTETARGFVRAFFDRHVAGVPGADLGRVAAPADVYVNVYPLGRKPPLPVRW